jgi:hypothetical protein
MPLWPDPGVSRPGTQLPRLPSNGSVPPPRLGNPDLWGPTWVPSPRRWLAAGEISRRLGIPEADVDAARNAVVGWWSR